VLFDSEPPRFVEPNILMMATRTFLSRPTTLTTTLVLKLAEVICRHSPQCFLVERDATAISGILPRTAGHRSTWLMRVFWSKSLTFDITSRFPRLRAAIDGTPMIKASDWILL
jgi:hypothetical protein